MSEICNTYIVHTYIELLVSKKIRQILIYLVCELFQVFSLLFIILG